MSAVQSLLAQVLKVGEKSLLRTCQLDFVLDRAILLEDGVERVPAQN